MLSLSQGDKLDSRTPIAFVGFRSPSFWVKRSEVRHRYKKVADFWVPTENTTDSAIRRGGHAFLSIEYKDYEIVGAIRPIPAEHPDENSSAPVTGQENTAVH